ncbi:hypothetical protein [Nocardia sp. XZ_19_369]|uniref:hypothetical protein n=1 Tax=Nocardia sp. XZ_19_369 TaxID=2769487 RepID=UPI00189089A0|nr:hypothetical protein [Nocardia sp. XZ_19_369]
MDGYDRDRYGIDPNTRGRIFENGTYKHFRDRENGYVQQSEKYRAAGVKIRFDKVKDLQGKIHSIEEKSGRMDTPKDAKQLEAVRELIEKGVIQHHTLRTVAGELKSQEVQQLIAGLVRDFPDKFTHHVISRETAREIWAKGLQREQGTQLELPGVAQKAREQKGVDLQKRREKVADIAKVRDRKERARERLANIRQIVKAREEQDRARAAGEAAARRVALDFPAPEHLRRVEAPTADRAPAREAPAKTTQIRGSPEAAALVELVERDAARLAARDFPFPVPDKPREQQTVEIGGESTREVADTVRVERAAEKARVERDAADKATARERARAMEQAQLQGISPEVRDLLKLGQAQPPTAAVETKPGYAPGVERGGTGQGRDLRTPEIGPRSH